MRQHTVVRTPQWFLCRFPPLISFLHFTYPKLPNHTLIHLKVKLKQKHFYLLNRIWPTFFSPLYILFNLWYAWMYVCFKFQVRFRGYFLNGNDSTSQQFLCILLFTIIFHSYYALYYPFFLFIFPWIAWWSKTRKRNMDDGEDHNTFDIPL